MNWFQFFDNPQAIESLYETPPSCEKVELIRLHHDLMSKSLVLELDFPSVPDYMPRKWESSFNHTVIHVECHLIDDLEVLYKDSIFIGGFKVKRKEENIREVCFQNETSLVRVTCKGLTFLGFDGYQCIYDEQH